MEMVESLINKDSFVGLDTYTWLYTGAESPIHQGNIEAVNNYLQSRSKGPGGREKNDFIEQLCKQNIAELVQSKEENVAFLSNSSEIISMIAHSLQLEAGDNVVINELEFPSGVLPWLSLQEIGVEVRVVPHTQWQVKVDDILQQVDENTRLVMTSHVSYLSGARMDNKQLYQALKQTNALLLTDVTQSLGVVPVDIKDTDFLVCSSYKWLLSTHGLGILVLNPTRIQHINPSSIGWRSVADAFNGHRFERYELYDDARKFNLGFPSYPTIYSLQFTTSLLLDVGITNIEKHVLQLGEALLPQLKGLDLELLTPLDPNHRAGNIAFKCSNGERVAEELRKENVFVWGGDGRVRVSLHLFNDSRDITTFIQKLSKIKGKLETSI